MIEQDLRYCTRCNGEYLPEVQKCGICGIDLVSGKDLLSKQEQKQHYFDSRKGELTPGDDVVTIFSGSLSDVKRLESRFKQDNIGFAALGDDPSCNKGCCGGGQVELQVRREDAPAAMAIIDSDYVKTTSFDEDQSPIDEGFDPDAEVNLCPACGSTFTTSSTTCPDCGLCFA